MIYLSAALVVVSLVAAYAIRLYFADRDKARSHDSKLSSEILSKLEPLDEHVRSSLAAFKTTMVECLKEQREIVKGLDFENKRVVSGKAVKNLLGGRLPEP